MHNLMPQYLSFPVSELVLGRERTVDEQIGGFQMRRAFSKLLNGVSSRLQKLSVGQEKRAAVPDGTCSEVLSPRATSELTHV